MPERACSYMLYWTKNLVWSNFIASAFLVAFAYGYQHRLFMSRN